MARPDITLRQWLAWASTEEQLALAKAADTSVAYLRQVAAPPRAKYRRVPGPDLAGRIEAATETIGPGRVPRTLLVPACAQCRYARACGAAGTAAGGANE